MICNIQHKKGNHDLLGNLQSANDTFSSIYCLGFLGDITYNLQTILLVPHFV